MSNPSKAKTKSTTHAAVRAEVHAEQGEAQPGSIVVGDWYWLRLDEDDRYDDASDEDEDLTETDEEDTDTWQPKHEDGLVRHVQGDKRFVCVVDLGTNYAKVEDVYGSTWRIHFGHFLRECEPESNPDAVIAREIAAARKGVQLALSAVQEIHQRLALQQTRAARAAETTGLARLAGHSDPKAHQNALVKARDKDLPALYAEMRRQNKEMATWLAARAIPFRAMATGLQETISEINDKVFNIELYAGLVETIETVHKGKPAPLGTKLHLMQRMHFMDEECLLDYEAGGMDFKRIGDFDAWLAKPEHMHRILPHPRCMLAFRVRRYAMKRKWTLENFIRFQEEDKMNTLTFLYIRNGERLSRLGTNLEFQEELFPDLERTHNLSGEGLYMHKGSHDVIPEARYDAMVKEFRKAEKEHAKRHAQWVIDAGAWDLFWAPQMASWQAQCDAIEKAYQDAVEAYNRERFPDGMPQGVLIRMDGYPERPEEPKRPDAPPRPREPYNHRSHPSRQWIPFDRSTVLYDDALKKIEADVQAHNRVALILQGIFDRTDVLHPHGPVRLWDVVGFDEAIELVYDTSHALTDGDPLDIEAYFARLRRSIAPGSYTMGQQMVWLKKMAEKENNRRSRASDDDFDEVETYHPRGNPGPGFIAPVVSVRGGKCRYEWQRTREFRDWKRGSIMIDEQINVDLNELFHVSAYKPGDYKPFFADPRTRAEYMKWAPRMLRAEDWHAVHGGAKPALDDSARKPMDLEEVTKRDFLDPVYVRRTIALKTKSGNPPKRGPKTRVEEGIVKFLSMETTGRPHPKGPGWHYRDVFHVKLQDGTKLKIPRDSLYGKSEGTAHIFEQDNVTYEFFWLTRTENQANKRTRKRRRRNIFS